MQSKSHDCSYCDYKASQRITLIVHMLLKHVDDSVQVNCPICSEGLTDRNALEERIQIIRGGHKSYECQRCHFKTLKLDEFEAHAHKDTTEKIVCRHCNKVFSKKWVLNIHLTISHGETNTFDCPQCTFTALNGGDLYKHFDEAHKSNKLYILSAME